MNRTNKRIVAALSLLLCIGAASAQDVEPETVVGSWKTIKLPSVGVETTAEIGNSIVSKAYQYTYSAVTILDSYEDKPNSPGTTKVFAGKLPLYKASKDGKFYRDSKATYTMLGAAVKTDDSGVFVPADKLKPAVIYHYRVGGIFGLGKGYVFGDKPIPVPEESLEYEWKTGSFKQELIYTGISKNVITLLYREYKDDYARPAFSQEIKYDLSEGNVIGYKGARFEVVTATNTDIAYKVVRPME